MNVTRTTTVPERFRAGIVRYQPSDADDLAAFQRATFGDDGRQLDPDRAEWLFEHNPSRRPGEGWAIWICRRKGEIVGQQAEIAFPLVADGEEHPAAWAIDLMVAPEWRIRGVGPGLVATHADERGLALGLTQNTDAAGIYLKHGWVEVGSVPVYRRLLAPGELLASRLRPLAPVADIGMRVVDVALAGAGRLAGLRLVSTDRFDSRVDEVWARASSDYRVLARRDLSTVGWYFDRRPEAPLYRRFYLVRGSATLGYAALRATEHRGAVTMSVVDYLAPAKWVAPLLTLAGRAARSEGAWALMCRTLNDPAHRSLRAAGFVQRGLDATSPMRFFVHGAPTEAATQPGGWFLTAADADLS